MKILKFPVDGPKPTQIQTTLSGFGFEKKRGEEGGGGKKSEHMNGRGR